MARAERAHHAFSRPQQIGADERAALVELAASEALTDARESSERAQKEADAERLKGERLAELLTEQTAMYEQLKAQAAVQAAWHTADEQQAGGMKSRGRRVARRSRRTQKR